MKTLFTLGAMLALVSGIFCQPEITSINMPSDGEHYPIAIIDTDATNVGDAGMNIDWDFSGLIEAEEQAFDFMNPGGTIFGYRYPDATIAGYGWNNSYSYYEVGADMLSVHGHAIVLDLLDPTDTSFVDFDNPESVINLPFTYNDSFNDDFDGESIALGFTQAFTGTTSVEVDGYGTLTLPNATYSNVIRIHVNRVQENDFGPDQTKEQHFWMSEDFKFWLLFMETSNTGFGDDHLVWYSKNPIPVSTSITEVEESDLELFPNPALDGQAVNLKADSPMLSVSIFDAKGALIYTQSANSLMNLQLHPAFDPGLYHISVETIEGVQTKRLIIQ